MIFTDIRKTRHTARSYSRPGISEETKETNKPRGLKAPIIRFAQSKFRIVHALHNKNAIREKAEKPLLFKLTLRSRFTLSRAHSVLSRATSHVAPVNTLFQIGLITNWVRN